MPDFGTSEEREAALKVCELTMALNNAIADARDAGVNVKIIDTEDDWDRPSSLQVSRMERRVRIVPAQRSSAS